MIAVPDSLGLFAVREERGVFHFFHVAVAESDLVPAGMPREGGFLLARESWPLRTKGERPIQKFGQARQNSRGLPLRDKRIGDCDHARRDTDARILDAGQAASVIHYVSVRETARASSAAARIVPVRVAWVG